MGCGILMVSDSQWATIDSLKAQWEKAESQKDTTKATMLRGLLVDALAKTAPEGAERLMPYMNYLEDFGCLSYDQWLGLVEEQERDSIEESKPIVTSEDPNPF